MRNLVNIAAMEEPAQKYRADIAGLRALAIWPVIWYHSGLPGAPGGLTGVDTFFVISGYLITFIIHREVLAGTFRYRDFYERRVRRIAPGLLFVLVVTTIAAYTLLLPYELQEYARSAIAAVAMVSNVYFWRTANYFALADSITPLLHTWSLAVEEQFYLIFPLVLITAERRRAARPTVIFIGLASLILCLTLTLDSPVAAFYLLPTRSWELMTGAASALGLVSIPKGAKPIAGLCGIMLIVAAVLFINGSDPYPGWRATIPVIGSALVINTGPDTIASRLLGTTPLVYVGKISYSLYLWHWPVFVLLRHYQSDPELSSVSAAGGITASFVLAAVSYHWVENPARRRTTPYCSVLIASGSAVAVLLALVTIAIAGRGLPQRFSVKVNKLAEQRFAFAPLAHSCTDIGVDAALKRCHIGPPGKPEILLLGDSHAAAVSEGVGLGAARPGVVVSMGSCAPSLVWTDPTLRGRDPEACRQLMSRALKLALQDRTWNIVILSAYWTSYERIGGASFWNGVQRFVDRLTSPGRRIIVIAGIPSPSADVPWASAIRARFNRQPLRLECLAAHIPLHNVTVIDVSAGFCHESPAELFTDNNHVSRYAGETIIAPSVKRSLRFSG